MITQMYTNVTRGKSGTQYELFVSTFIGGICNQFSVAQWRKLWVSNRTIYQGQWFELWQKGKTYCKRKMVSRGGSNSTWGMVNVHMNGNWSEDNRKRKER